MYRLTYNGYVLQQKINESKFLDQRKNKRHIMLMFIDPNN